MSASDCWAVGVSEKSDTAPDLNEVLRFNGKKWARVAAPNPGGKAAGDESQLFGVACASASDCWAVGLSRNGSGAAYLNQALRFNGTKWSEVTTPEPGGKVSGDQNELDGVACASASSCWAVGYSQRGSGAAELDQALRFNGKKWSAVTTPEPGGTAADDDSRLLGVTCASASECWAVGYSEGGNAAAERNQALRFNGKQWSTVKTPQPAGESSGAFDALAGVACVSAPDCYAVGGSGNEALRILSNEVQHWNGKTWSAVKPAVVVPSPGEGSLLNSVACAAASDCWAVGYSERKSGADRNEALHWDGKKWSVVATPNPAGKRSGDSDELLGVRCVRASDCWAVGYSQSGRRAADLNEVLQWNGKTWSVVATPDPGGANSGDRNELIGVTCVSASSCWAVGYSQDTGGQLNEALHFNGNAWSVVATPDPGGTDLGDFNVLEGVACASGSRCWAVGYSQSGSSAALNEALRFNGKKWVPGTISDPGGSASGDSNILFGVTCVSASDCWAVGETENASADLNQAFHWNGKSWSLTSTPEPGTGSSPFGNPLNGVACISASDCWAVGYYLNRHSTAVLNEALRWNGEKWSHVATPEPGGKLDVANILLGVSCSSESACRAVGEITPGLELGVNQALHFDGKRWQAG